MCSRFCKLAAGDESRLQDHQIFVHAARRGATNVIHHRPDDDVFFTPQPARETSAINSHQRHPSDSISPLDLANHEDCSLLNVLCLSQGYSLSRSGAQVSDDAARSLIVYSDIFGSIQAIRGHWGWRECSTICWLRSIGWSRRYAGYWNNVGYGCQGPRWFASNMVLPKSCR